MNENQKELFVQNAVYRFEHSDRQPKDYLALIRDCSMALRPAEGLCWERFEIAVAEGIKKSMEFELEVLKAQMEPQDPVKYEEKPYVHPCMECGLEMEDCACPPLGYNN